MWPFDDDTSTTPDPNAEPSQGRLSEAFANPYVSIPYAIGSGIASMAAPRLASGINTGLGLGMAAEKGAYALQQKKRLSEAVNRLAGATTEVPAIKAGMDPATTTYALADQPKIEPQLAQANIDTALSGGESPLAQATQQMTQPTALTARGNVPESQRLFTPPEKLPTYLGTEQQPMLDTRMQNYLKTVGKIDPTSAMHTLGTLMTQKPDPYHISTDREGNVIAVHPRTLQSKTIQAAPVVSFEQAQAGIPKNIPAGQKITTHYGPRGQSTITAEGADMTPKLPPPISDTQLAVMVGKVQTSPEGFNALNDRELAMLGIKDRAEAAQVLPAMWANVNKLVQEKKVDLAGAIASTIGAIHIQQKLHTPGTGANHINPETGEMSNPSWSKADSFAKGMTLEVSEKEKTKLAELDTIDNAWNQLKIAIKPMKTGNAALMAAGAIPGAQYLSSNAEIGAAYDAERYRFSQKLNALTGGMRAAASLPFDRFTAEKLLPDKVKDSEKVIDFKEKSTEIYLMALKDEKIREVTGRPPNPKIKTQLDALADQLEAIKKADKGPAQGAAGARPKPGAAPAPAAPAGPAKPMTLEQYRASKK